jgi:poly(beta-D-mannuronate) lyase
LGSDPPNFDESGRELVLRKIIQRFEALVKQIRPTARKYVALGGVIIISVGIVLMLSLGSGETLTIPSPVDDAIALPIRTIQVASIDGLDTAVENALPGDHIVITNGSYSLTSPKVITVKGTASNPIVIKAQDSGRVLLGGSHGLRFIDAEHLIISGFKFTHSQDKISEGDNITILCNNCKHVRFTNNTFALNTNYTGQADAESIERFYSHWLGFSGKSSNNRIDHNLFIGKTTRGVFLMLLGDGNNAVKYTVVDHNRFFGHSFPYGNGGECMTLGNSAMGLSPAFLLLEYNTFDQCNGDRETITIKASKNIIRYNTFHDNLGSLTFRHGNGNIAEGNVFVDGDNGIRIYGSGHRIVNNYFARNPVQVSSLLGPIVIGKGTVPQDLAASNAEYSQARDIVIAHNTLVNNGIGITIGYGEGKYGPENITIANNIITGNTGLLLQAIDANVSFKNNIVYPTGSATIGEIPTHGYLNVNPALEVSAGMYRPSSSSPAIDAIPASEAHGVTKDIDGRLRSGMHDIGAHEAG